MTKEKKIHDKLLGIRKKIPEHKISDRTNYTARSLADDIIFDLALAAGKGKLSEEQYQEFDQSSRADLLCKFLEEARTVLREQRERYDIKPWTFSMPDFVLRLEKNVYRLTREQMAKSYGVEDWHSTYRPYGDNIDDIFYQDFVKQHGIDSKWATKKLSFEGREKLPEVYRRAELMQALAAMRTEGEQPRRLKAESSN